MNKTGRLHFARGGRVPDLVNGGYGPNTPKLTGDTDTSLQERSDAPRLVAVGDVRQVAEAHKLEEANYSQCVVCSTTSN
jgi:hypothetical protein